MIKLWQYGRESAWRKSDDFEVCRQIQTINWNVPIIFLTSLSDSHHAVEGLELGAFDYIRKDASLREIDARIKSVLARTGGHSSIVHITADSYIDNRQMTVIVCKERYKVSLRIIKLLHLLLQQKNHLCAREALIVKIWGYDCINSDVYLNQSIGKLRSILSADKRVEINAYRNSGVVLRIKD